MPVAVEKPDLSVVSHKFQGIFNANVFSELAVLTESKMVFFKTGPLLKRSQAHLSSQGRPFSPENYCLYCETVMVSISFS